MGMLPRRVLGMMPKLVSEPDPLMAMKPSVNDKLKHAVNLLMITFQERLTYFFIETINLNSV